MKFYFNYWNKMSVSHDIRGRLQLVGSMIPETGANEYFSGMNYVAWSIFNEMYDEVPAGDPSRITI